LSESASDIMADLALRYFDNQCFVTHQKFKKRGFVIHHLKYINNDVVRGNYPKGEKGRTAYLKALRPMVENMPFRFIMVTNGIHTRMDHIRRGLTRMKRDNFMRLVVAVLMTEKHRRKYK
jgi:hypothetical protein